MNEHIIFDLVSRAMCRVYVYQCMQGFFFFTFFFLYVLLFSLDINPLFLLHPILLSFYQLLLPKKSHMEIKCLNKWAARRCVYVNYVSHQKFLPLFFVDILIHIRSHKCWHFQFNIYWLMHSSFLWVCLSLVKQNEIASFAEFFRRIVQMK